MEALTFLAFPPPRLGDGRGENERKRKRKRTAKLKAAICTGELPGDVEYSQI